MNSNLETCPLCEHKESQLYFSRVDKRYGERLYYQCAECDLVFLAQSLRLPENEEKARYETHENDPTQEGYVKFLNQVLLPLKDRIPTGAHGLDYGCGPGPAIKFLLEKVGYPVENYDPYFFPDKEVLEKKYDFLTCTEVIEHVASPLKVFKKMLDLLRDEGVLAVMTQIRYDKINFESWWYHKDPTHICFFSNKTFAWIAKRFNIKWESTVDNVIFFKK